MLSVSIAVRTPRSEYNNIDGTLILKRINAAPGSGVKLRCG